jgi:ABC-2 type transport system ATP-binding protein
VIRELRSRGACVVITTHELAEAEQLADRVVIVRAGRVLADGSPAALTGGGAAALRFATARPIDTAALSAALAVPVHEEHPQHYRIDAPTPPSVAELTSWLSSQEAELTELRTGRSLEETYLALVGEADAAPGAPAGPEPGRRRHRRPPR